MNKVNFYVEQHEHFALGNFIACTPTIKALYERYQQRIPVLFKTEYVKQCYMNSTYIEIIDEPGGRRRLFGSDLICRANTMTDYDFIAKHIVGLTVQQPFIDEYALSKPLGPYGVFINGSGSEAQHYLDRKLIPLDVQAVVRDNSKIPVIGVGSLNDAERNIFAGYYGDIRQALAIINGAEWVISNVTGFYHAAGAMHKRQLVLWKDCLWPRCSNISPYAERSTAGNWANDIIKFLNE